MLKKITDNKKFWLAVFLCVAGTALLFTGLILPPVGVISSSVLGGSGELLLTGGAILGVDVAYGTKLKDIIKQLKEEEHKDEHNTTIAEN
jgi:hypothetical protein